METKIKFCGAAGTVTGSCYWLRHNGQSFLIDCGMYQGSKTLKELNYSAFPFDPATIDFVLLTHAHIDHSGLIPKLIKYGFTGRVHMTEGTRDLLSFMLPDSGYIQESEVAFLNRRNQQRGKKEVSPIYTRQEAEKSIGQFDVIEYEEWRNFGDGVRARFWNAGHILGAASIELELAQNASDVKPIRILFSGDIGPEHKLFHPDPVGPEDLDYLICESTYGDRSRPSLSPKERRQRLAEVISQTESDGGVLVVPAFSVERTQELLADISLLMMDKSIGESLVFLDSPMAIRATEVFAQHADVLEDTNGSRALFDNKNFVFTLSVEESKNISNYKNGVIIVAASGMCEAGRIRHHLKRRLWDPHSTILIIGYQAPGTLGALLLAGKKKVRIQGDDIKVLASIKKLDIYSGHADADELEIWVRERAPVHRALFLTHGDPKALDAFRNRLLGANFGEADIIIPKLDDEYILKSDGLKKLVAPASRLEDAAVAQLDWHNDLAQLSLDIRDEIDNAADERSRQIIIRRLRRALEDKPA